MRTHLVNFVAAFLVITSCLAGDKPVIAPVFTGKTMNGEILKLSEYKGKVTVLDFWASWCGPCKEEFPFLVALQEKLKKNSFGVVSINLDTELENVHRFLSKQKTQPSFPIVLDAEGKIPTLYNVSGMPTTVLIDKNGNVRFRHTGFTPSEMDKIITETAMLLRE